MTYLAVALGSAIGGVLRYALTRLFLSASTEFPWGTILVNVLGCFVIGFFGTFTLAGGRFAVSENTRIFVMVGICGGFTTFSSFSLQTLDLLRNGAWAKASANIGLSVALCLVSVALGHFAAHHSVERAAIAQTRTEKLTG